MPDIIQEEGKTSTLQGRVAVVTGAGRGIGREHALLLASQGAAVVVNDLGGSSSGDGSSSKPAQAVADEIVDAGGAAVIDCGDVSTSEGADQLVATAVEAFGHLDVLVNNAGILRDGAIVNLDDTDWDLSICVNLRGHFMPLRAAARYWRSECKQGRPVVASVINTSSESGVFANAGQANYAAAKSAIATLTEVASKELARYHVRTNAILPRARTRLTESLTPLPKADRFDRWDPANVSPFVAYLAMPECPLNGHVFLVGGSLVQRVKPWSLDPTWRLETDRRWSVRELCAVVDEIGAPDSSDRLTGMVR
jgi:NAD(P)-dependent dehydrogenase (short-subunit alcohol dehydrogenase family)